MSAIASLRRAMSILESDLTSAIAFRGGASLAFLAPAVPSLSTFAAGKRFTSTATIPVMAQSLAHN